MSNKYYYLISSLPYLFFENPALISLEDFFAECGKWLSRQDLKILQDNNINDLQINSGDLQIIKEWKGFNNSLREEIALLRAAKKTHVIEKAPLDVKEIFTEKNPLLMERRFEKVRWDFIEQQEYRYTYDINYLILYLFKLQILERLFVFNKERGKQEFEELTQLLSKAPV